MTGRTRDVSVGSEIAGYRIDAVAGQGGMGVVYRATDINLDRPVALKVISGELADDADFRARFKRESRLAASIRHPNVVSVFRAGEDDGLLYIAMDYIEGTDLKAVLAERGALDVATATDVIAQVASALDAAHAKGLVHRDVKPANVLISSRNGEHHAYLTDFGLTKEAASQSGMTKTGVVVGTVDYVAPEQIEGGPLDARADVYALGCMLYEVLTGQVPYPRDTSMAKMYAHLESRPPSVVDAAPGLPADVDRVVARAMAKRPEDRFPSAGDLGRALQSTGDATAIRRRERSVAVGAAAAGSRRRVPPLALAGAGLGVLAVAAVLLLVLGGGDSGSGRIPLTKDQYQDRVLDATRPVGTAIVAADRKVPPHVTDPKDSVTAARELATVRNAEDRSIAAVDKLTPPRDVKDLHARLMGVLRQTRSDVADAVAAADFGNDRNFQAALASFQRDTKALGTLGPAFKDRGYPRLGG